MTVPNHKTFFKIHQLPVVSSREHNFFFRYWISEGLWLDMIFIQRVVCFLSPNLGEGIENTQQVG